MTYSAVGNLEQVVEKFQSFDTDCQLALLWYVYEDFGGAISQKDSTDVAGYEALDSLVPEIQQMTPEEQLQIMRDLLGRANTPINQTYGSMDTANKLAFWYRLAQSMDQKAIAQVPSNYSLSSEAEEFLQHFNQMDFDRKVIFMRNVVSQLGVNANN
ncbi:MAG: hypothetical protein KME21_24290 [Desmonostoc vinosum HA7617-LM4]|jgi:hypothetical protein|nr:hypothetical protein [Desmonostoc vinosum HA7617-LM4]